MIYTLTLNPAIDRELTVEEIEYDKVLSALEARVDFGGKGFNVSRMLMALGTSSVAVGFVGGNTGRRLQDGLHALGIDSDFVWVETETRTNISVVTQAHDHYIKVNEKGPLVGEAKQAELLDKIESIARAGDWWVLAGSLPPGVDDAFYARIIKVLNERQAVAVLDTTGEALRLGCYEKPFLIKPNGEETQALTAMPVDTPVQVALAASELRKMGAQNAVISLGKSGALLQTAEATWMVHPPVVREKNPIGAGDAMVGGLVWALAQKIPLDEALSWGVASGAAAASLSGTNVGSLAQVMELRSQVRIETLEIPVKR
jgi:1-phosphofructokinase family hexose kinase